MTGAARHHRHSIRLRGYDYAQTGAYFVTVCAQDRACLFGDVIDGVMRLNDSGRIAADEWTRSGTLRTEIAIDEWVVMPNHVHGIVVITGGDARRGDRPVAPTPGPRPRSLGAMIAGFKSAATTRINEQRGTPGAPVWQRNYYEHIVRDEDDLNRIRQYIRENPAHWASDRENPG